MQQNEFIRELQPLFFVQTILGWNFARRVVTRRGLHYLEVRIFSWQFLYAVIALSVQLIIAFHLFYLGLKSVTLITPDFQHIYYVILTSKMLPHILPILIIIQKPLQISFCNEWSSLQSQIEKCSLSGKSLDLKLKKELFLKITMIFCTLIMMIIVRSYKIAQLSFFHSIFLVLSLMNEACVFTWWQYSCKALRNLSSHLLCEYILMTEYNEEGKCNKLLTKAVLDLRSPWIQYFKLVQSAGSSLSIVLSFVVINSFSKLLFLAYIMCTVGDSRIVNFFGGMFAVGTLALLVLCQSTHKLHTGIHQDLLQAVQYTKKLRINKKARHDMNDFLIHLLKNRPEVTFSGYISAGRQLMNTLISAFITYIIVILQLQSNFRSINFKYILEINDILFK